LSIWLLRAVAVVVAMVVAAVLAVIAQALTENRLEVAIALNQLCQQPQPVTQ
jgi:ABC-type uncharacterized transport system permease subunit